MVNFKVDGLDTIPEQQQQSNNEPNSSEKNSENVGLHHVNVDRQPKMVVAGVGDISIGHGHLHHANKVIDF